MRRISLAISCIFFVSPARLAASSWRVSFCISLKRAEPRGASMRSSSLSAVSVSSLFVVFTRMANAA
jgi:hypothetical protein